MAEIIVCSDIYAVYMIDFSGRYKKNCMMDFSGVGDSTVIAALKADIVV